MNWFSLFLASIVPLVIGFIYFHKALLGKADNPVMSGLGDTLAKKILGAIGILIASFFISFFLLNFNNDGINQEGDFDTFAHGAWHGAFLTVTVVIPVILINGWLHQLTWRTRLMQILYWFTCLVIMGGIVDSMNHWQNILIPAG